jgi:hypothetical protein
MKWYFPVFCFLFVTACKSTIPSESIAQGVVSDLNAHQQAIQVLEKQTTKECKTDAFVASLNALKAQTESIAGQVKSISQACQTEKRVLEQSITIREIVIGVLGALLLLLVYLFVKKK